MTLASDRSELVLGTVQFGLAYGIAGQGGPVPEARIRAILEQAADAGIRRLDTAAAYGDIEERLAGLCAGLDLRIGTKIGPRPPDLTGSAVLDWTGLQILRSRDRLGDRLERFLWDRAEDLKGPEGADVVALAAELLGPGVHLGVSHYAPGDIAALSHLPLAAVQVPGNVFDRRFAGQTNGQVTDVRSVFLQGLLVGPRGAMQAKLPHAAPALARWHAWLDSTGLEAPTAAIGAARALFPGAGLVIGVETPEQLSQTLAAWAEAPRMPPDHLAVDDDRVIRPDLWPDPTEGTSAS